MRKGNEIEGVGKMNVLLQTLADSISEIFILTDA
jgi:hypothetical protein